MIVSYEKSGTVESAILRFAVTSGIPRAYITINTWDNVGNITIHTIDQKLELIDDPKNLPTLVAIFPGIIDGFKELLMLWLRKKGKTLSDYPKYLVYKNYNLPPTSTYTIIDKNKLKLFDSTVGKLKANKAYNSHTQKITYSFWLNDPISPYELFVYAKPSSNIPYLKYIDGSGSVIHKIDQYSTIEREWLDETSLELGVVVFKLFVGGVQCDCVFDGEKGTISPSSVITIDEKSLSSALQIGCGMRVVEDGVKISLDVPSGVVLNKAVISDIVDTDAVVSSIFFISEPSKSSEKRRSIVYCSPDLSYSTRYAIKISFTSKQQVNISGFRTQKEAENFLLIGCGFIDWIISHTENTKGLYTLNWGIPTSDINTYNLTLKKMKKIDEKTGKKLALLKSIDPDEFSTGYATVCEKKRQPNYIKPNEVDQHKKEYFQKMKTLGINPESTMMDYKTKSGKDMFLSCPPREEENSKQYIYIGMKKNKPPKNVGQEAVDYSKNYPSLPCCYKNDQLIKTRIEKKQKAAYTLGSYKELDFNQHGEVPFYFDQFIRSSGYGKKKESKKTISSFFRKGSRNSTSGILHCMEMVLSDDYFMISHEQSEQKIKETRLSIAKTISGGCRSILEDTEKYMDPCKFKSIVENWYSRLYDTRIVIHIYKTTPKQQQGEFYLEDRVLPTLRGVYSNVQHIIIVETKVISNNNPKCDIVVHQKPDGHIIDYFDDDNKLVQLISKAEAMACNNLFIGVD